MENASKALAIAGGVLIAIITIGFLVKSFSTINEFQMSQLSQEEQEQLIAFNEQYTKYLNQYVYGTEVITLQNRYENDKLVKVILAPGSEQPTMKDNHYEYISEEGGKGYYSNKVKYYKCTGITYDEDNRKSKFYNF